MICDQSKLNNGFVLLYGFICKYLWLTTLSKLNNDHQLIISYWDLVHLTGIKKKDLMRRDIIWCTNQLVLNDIGSFYRSSFFALFYRCKFWIEYLENIKFNNTIKFVVLTVGVWIPLQTNWKFHSQRLKL